MAGLEYDVVFFDNVSSAYREDTPNEKGLGGSELEVILLSQELARNGFSVLVLNDPIKIMHPGPSLDEPIIAPSGVHYASCRRGKPQISCGALIIQRFSSTPSAELIRRDRTLVWLHDACGGPNDATAQALAAATAKPLNRGGAEPVFISAWERTTYPAYAIGRRYRTIPNMLPRLLFDKKWQSVAQEDTLVYASAAFKGLAATLVAWSDPRVAAAGKTILEIMGPIYDRPAGSPHDLNIDDPSLVKRIKLRGSLPLPQLVERLAASRGLLFVNAFPETFCLVVAYTEALGKPARFIATSQTGVAGVAETMVNKRFLYERRDWDRFLSDLAAEISSGERLAVDPVRKFHPETVMPVWLDALGLEA